MEIISLCNLSIHINNLRELPILIFRYEVAPKGSRFEWQPSHGTVDMSYVVATNYVGTGNDTSADIEVV